MAAERGRSRAFGEAVGEVVVVLEPEPGIIWWVALVVSSVVFWGFLHPGSHYMTSYYEVFEVAAANIPDGNEVPEEESNNSSGHRDWWSNHSWARWNRQDNWSWYSGGGREVQDRSGAWSSGHSQAWEEPAVSERGSDVSWDDHSGCRGVGGRSNWSYGGDADSGVVSNRSNWSYDGRACRVRGDPVGRARGEATVDGGHRGAAPVTEPASPPAPGFDRDGNPPSGEVSSVGDGGGPRAVNADETKKPGGKVSNTYPPIFRAKPGESYRDWRRSVDFWLGGEGHQIPVEYIGPRIMVQLRDRAAQLVRHLNNDDVNKADGMAKIFTVLERSPLVKQLDKHRVDQHRKRLMSLNRMSGESLESYITRGNIYRNQLVGLDSTLEMGEKFYIGHLLDHARLTRRDKALVRTRAGEETEESVTNAMIELAAELEGEHGYPIGASEPNVAGANGEEFLVQRAERNFGGGGKKFFGKAALGVDLMSQVGENDEIDTPLGDEQSEDGFDEDVPMEIVEAEKEAFAMHYKAKQRMAEVKKLRKYYKQGETAEERKKAIAEKMKVTACHNCGEVGHWSRECPRAKQPQQAYLAASTLRRQRKPPSSAMGTIEEVPVDDEEREWGLLMSLCSQEAQEVPHKSARAYMVLPRECGFRSDGLAPHDVLWCVEELKGSVILDLGCLKSVAGTRWMNQVIQRWKKEGRWFKVCEEKETFRFGNGETLPSRYGVLLHATFAGKDVILNFSVVKGDCPPLLSRPACTQLGAIFDCSQHTLASRRLGVKQYGLTQTLSGHYTMCIEEFGEGSMKVQVPNDFIWKLGDEVYIWPHEQPVLALQSFGSGRNDCDALEQTHGRDQQSLPSMRRSRASIKGLSRHSVGRRSGATSAGGNRDGRDQRGEHAEETAVSGAPGSSCGAEDAASSEGCDEFSMVGGGGDQASGVQDGCGHRDLSHGEGEGDDSEEAREDRASRGQEDREQGTHRYPSRLPVAESRVERRGPIQRGRECQVADAGLHVEEGSVATEDEAGSGDDFSRSPMEEEQEVAVHAVRQGSSSNVGPLRGDEAEAPCTGGGGADVETSPEGCDSMEGIDSNRTSTQEEMGSDGLPMTTSDEEDELEYHDGLKDILAAENNGKLPEDKWERPPRGVTQKMKQGIRSALAVMEQVINLPTDQNKLMVLEIFAGTAMLTRVASGRPGWGAYNPIDVLYGEEFDLTKEANRRRILALVKELKPDLAVITPPCGPWSQWQHLREDLEALFETRRQHLPFWKLTRQIWDEQTKEERLALTEQPELSEALNLRYMQGREETWRVRVGQCKFGLKDPVSGLLYKKATALDVNDKEFAYEIARVKRCNHTPEEHEQIKGMVYYEGKWQRRSSLASRWTEKMAKHILWSAERALFMRQEQEIREQSGIEWELAEPVKGEGWEAFPVDVDVGGGVLTPDEVLRRQLQSMGAEGERYDYINFEGTSRALPRRLRSTLAHLHVVLGHISNERLARMIAMAGGSKELIGGCKEMRCQVCAMVRPPGSKPQVSYTKPTNFNQRVSGDCFHVWDVENVRYTVVHFLDDLTDYHVADVGFDTNSTWTADVLRRKWYDIFGAPDVLVTDAGTEFRGAMERLNDLFAVKHDPIPDQAKWRLGHAERHGAVLKIMLMKTVAAVKIDSLEDMQHALTAALGAKNRLTNNAGVSPLQAVTGRNTPLPGSLLAQLQSGKVRFTSNEMIDQDEALRRAERIRSAAIESCHWLDAHEGLRRALAARSRPPHLELIKEGTVVYVYDPPAHRRGLARRLQDNASWTGPGVVVCVERDGTIPKKVWIRVRARVKAYPLEKVRLATADEMVSAQFITNALMDVQAELDGGTLRVADPPAPQAVEENQPEEATDPPQAKVRAVKPQPAARSRVPKTPPLAKTSSSSEDSEKLRKLERKREMLHDVPPALGRKKLRMGEEDEIDPSRLAFQQKRRLFDELARELAPPTAMQQAHLRSQLEEAYDGLKRVRKTLKQDKKAEARAYATRASESGGATASRAAYAALPVYHEEMLKIGGDTADVWYLSEYHADVWYDDEEGNKGFVDQAVQLAERMSEEAMHAAYQADIVTGKLRVEYKWNGLTEAWKQAYREPLLKAVDVYFEHDAIVGVVRDAMVDPRKILSSRFVLTNKGKENLEEAELKARWIIGGHRDQELGRYPTLAPTSSLMGHNLLNFLAVQFQWVVHYEDVSAAFLQGSPLPPDREVYVRLPSGYPPHVNDFIVEKVGTQCRGDLVRMVKGGFGLAESPRLWYMEYKATLKQIDLHELKLIPGMFAAWHPDGRLRAMVCIHVDDTRYAGDETSQEIWDKLHQKLKFGKLRKATDGWTKFCGRWERQDPTTLEMVYSMDEYCAKIPDLEAAFAKDGKDLTAEDRVKLGSILGQVNWAARQGRYDLSYGVSHCQQLAGLGMGEAREWVKKVVQRAKKSLEVRVPRLGCEIEEMVVISASDAAYAAQPRSASQGGVICLIAHPKVTEEPAPVAIIEGQSMKISRVVRCSMAAELSMAAEGFEHGDFMRAVLAELMMPKFELRRWKWFASRWRHYLVIDAKTGYDVLNNESMTSDRKIMIDAAALREALVEEGAENFVRWIPGLEMIADGLTKWSDNGVLQKVMTSGEWCLVDTEQARQLRYEAGCRKRKYDAKRRLSP